MKLSLATTPEFGDHARVADGASELLAEVFGPGRTSTRSVAGVLSLPLGAPVVVEIILELAECARADPL